MTAQLERSTIKAVGISLLFAATLFAAALSPAKAEQLGGLRIAGLVTATADAQGGVVAAARGCAVFAGDGRTCARAMTADAVVRVASISKLVTALGVLRLVEAGTLDLDRDVSLYLGYWVRNPAFPDTPVTLRHLLSHVSTLTDAPGYVFGLGERVAPSLGQPGRWDTAHAPGSFFRYSNYNFVLTGTIMEAASGERFDRLMDRLVIKPLGVEGCFNWDACSDATLARAAALYRTGKDETQFDPDGPWIAQTDDLKGRRPACPVYRANPETPCDLSTYRPGVNGGLFSPQGGLRVSALGLAAIAEMLIREGRGPHARFLKPASVQALLSPVWRYDGGAANGETEKGTLCAFGLSTHVLGVVAHPDCRDGLFADGRPRYGHVGEAYGLYGGFWIDPQGRRGTIYLTTGTSRHPGDSPGERSGFTLLEESAAAAVP